MIPFHYNAFLAANETSIRHVTILSDVPLAMYTSKADTIVTYPANETHPKISVANIVPKSLYRKDPNMLSIIAILSSVGPLIVADCIAMTTVAGRADTNNKMEHMPNVHSLILQLLLVSFIAIPCNLCTTVGQRNRTELGSVSGTKRSPHARPATAPEAVNNAATADRPGEDKFPPREATVDLMEVILQEISGDRYSRCVKKTHFANDIEESIPVTIQAMEVTWKAIIRSIFR